MKVERMFLACAIRVVILGIVEVGGREMHYSIQVDGREYDTSDDVMLARDTAERVARLHGGQKRVTVVSVLTGRTLVEVGR